MTPCRLDPAAWDIEMPASGMSDLLRRRVRMAVQSCNACPERPVCLAEAIADPPSHPCVQAGLVWDKKPRARYGPTRPFRLEEWSPHLRSERERPEPFAACPSPLAYLQHLARGERGMACGCSALAGAGAEEPVAAAVAA